MSTKNIVKGVVVLLVVVLLVGVLGVVFKLTNGFNESFKTFYIEYNGKQILTEKSKMSLARGEDHVFTVKYLFDGKGEEQNDYSVKVIPNLDIEESNFDFNIDGKPYSYIGIKDLTKAFKIKKEVGKFTLSIPENETMLSVLQKLYPEKTITMEETFKSLPYVFSLVISSYNEKVTYCIDFTFLVAATGVEFEEGEIIL